MNWIWVGIAAVIIGIGVGLALDQYWKRKSPFGFSDPWFSASTGALVGLFTTFALAMLVNAIFASSIKPVYKSEKTRLVQVADGVETQGRFSLFSGYVDGEQQFYFYAANGEDLYADSVPADRTKIRQDAESYPTLETIKDVQTSTDWLFYHNEPDTYIIHVPKGTVIEKATLDGPGN